MSRQRCAGRLVGKAEIPCGMNGRDVPSSLRWMAGRKG